LCAGQDVWGSHSCALDAQLLLGIALQFTFTKAEPARGLRSWIALDTSSLPVPVSPKTKTVVVVGATSSTCCSTSTNARLVPTIPGNTLEVATVALMRSRWIGRFITISPCSECGLHEATDSRIILSKFAGRVG
jgi:hypothetical protein